MTRIGRRLVEDFLLPALNSEKYGDLLKWVDRDKCYFVIRWSHKNAAKWCLEDTRVFQDWDKLKGHYHPEIGGYYMQAKQRFRAALYKLSTVRNVPSEDKRYKKYQLILDPDKRKTENIGSPKAKSPKKVENNRVSVIKKHTSGKERSGPAFYAPPSSPPSIASSDDSDCSDSEFAHCIHDYKLGQRNLSNLAMSNNPNQGYNVSPIIDGPLREVNDDLSRGIHVQRTPHVPTQPVPVYNGGVRQPNEISPPESQMRARVESPRVLLVKTYNEEDVSAANGYTQHTEYMEYDEIVNGGSPNCALNLSLRSDDSDVASR